MTPSEKMSTRPSMVLSGRRSMISGGQMTVQQELGYLHNDEHYLGRLYPQADFQDYSVRTLKEMFAGFAAEKRDRDQDLRLDERIAAWREGPVDAEDAVRRCVRAGTNLIGEPSAVLLRGT